MVETMLVALDHAGCGVEVADQAAQYAARLRQEVVLMHVVQLPDGVRADDVVTRCGPGDIKGGTTAIEGLTADAMSALSRFARAFTSRGVATRIEVRRGKPATAILAAAEDNDVALVALGTHGRKGLERLFMGSVAEEVVRDAPCPVMIFRMTDGNAGRTAAQLHVAAETQG